MQLHFDTYRLSVNKRYGLTGYSIVGYKIKRLFSLKTSKTNGSLAWQYVTVINQEDGG